MNINLYDFDKTIYDGDSSVDFFFYSLKKHPKIIRRFPKMFIYFLKHYVFKSINKTEMKEVIFSYLQDLKDVDSYLVDFWNKHYKKLKKFYMDKDHSNDIIISASPEFLLESMKEYLGVLDLMATPVDKKTGKFNGLNCHDVEKVSRLNKKYKNYHVLESYSDSLSDTPILELADNAYIVKGNKLKNFR